MRFYFDADAASPWHPKVFAALASTALGPAQVAIQLNTVAGMKQDDARLRVITSC